MYIFDCLYGKMEFEKKIYLCMLTPEMQRLREIRLGNINSLFLTGSANINRFEHSLGTAYLAQNNFEHNLMSNGKKDKKIFILAALFHDLANGPFGHAYEYIQQKQGFIPEMNINTVIFGDLTGSHGKTAILEPIYMGQLNRIRNILGREEITKICEIIGGKNPQYSKLISDDIDIDNIDNVFRMAFHMGIRFNIEAPMHLARGLLCQNGKVIFKDEVVQYINEWYKVRAKVYNFLLYNPQDFAAKCMLAEAMDLVIKTNSGKIRWYYTDDELIKTIKDIGEIWTYCELKIKYIENKTYSLENIGAELLNCNKTKDVLQQCFNIHVPPSADVRTRKQEDTITIEYYNTIYNYRDNALYKQTKVCINTPQIVTRLMTGDLYQCIAIFRTKDISCYDLFTDLSSRQMLENECNAFLEEMFGDKANLISFHVILDKNKTNRQLSIRLLSGNDILIGQSTNYVIIGTFLKSPVFGLAKGKKINENKREKLQENIGIFLRRKNIQDLEACKLYEEVKCVE